MKIEKKGAALNGTWAKVGQDVRDGDRLQIKDAGSIDTSGNFGPKKVFKIMTTKKEEFIMNFNQTSLNNLVEGFGEESQDWIGKVVKAFVVKQMVGDGLKNVAYLAPEGWEMDEDGNFNNPKASKETTYPEYDDSKEMPF
jgi:hypothetical protein